MNPIEAKLAEIRNRAKQQREESQLAALDNPGVQQAIIKQTIAESTTTKLEELNAACEAIVATMPIYNNATKENRKWKPTRTYGYGDQIAVLTGLLNGIQYAAAEHKSAMLEATGLSSTLVEDTLQTIGSQTYYSPKYEMVITGVPLNVDEFKAQVQLLNLTLGIDVNTAQVTPAKVAQLEQLAAAQATKNEAEHELTKVLEASTFAVA